MGPQTEGKIMAIRKNADDKLTLEQLMYALADDEATEESPTDVQTLSVELDKTPAEIMTVAKGCPILIGVDKIFVWLKYPDETVAEQLADLKGLKPPTLAIGKATKVDNTPPTTVESQQDNTEPEENDSMDNNTPESGEIQVIGQWENPVQETHYVTYDPENVTGHMIMPEPEFIPAPPEGVNLNVWELAFTATTKPARMYWYGKATEQILAYRAEQEKITKAEENVSEPVVVEKPRPIDPLTGQPYPF